MRAGQELNRFGPPAGAPRGVQEIIYSHAFVALPPQSALVVSLAAGDASLWDVQLYNRAWYEALDCASRMGSLNHAQAHVDADGGVRVVIAHEDPGVANWLDSQGRDEVLATVRWWRPPATPAVSSQVVPAHSLASVLPAGTAMVDEAGRREQIAKRTAHAAWRFRT
jgi:hypothetical protein